MMACDFYEFIKIPILSDKVDCLEVAPHSKGEYTMCTLNEEFFMIREEELRRLNNKLTKYFKWLDDNRMEDDYL